MSFIPRQSRKSLPHHWDVRGARSLTWVKQVMIVYSGEASGSLLPLSPGAENIGGSMDYLPLRGVFLSARSFEI
jgi:hypothetical protein